MQCGITLRMSALSTNFLNIHFSESTCCWPGHCCPSGLNLSQMRWCPSGPPTSWGIFLPTGSRVASNGWHYWGQPCSWGKRETLLASACGAENGCRRRTSRFISGEFHCVTILLHTQHELWYLPPPPARSCFFSFFFSNRRTRRDLKSKSLSYSRALQNTVSFCRIIILVGII